MLSTTEIRSALPADLPAIARLISQLGYPVRHEALEAILRPMLDDRRHAVVVAEHLDDGIVAMMSLSSRPVLRLQGWIGLVEELVVEREHRSRGLGDRLIQYAKGVAAERGWVRLETVVARKRESNRLDFLFSRGFMIGDCLTYRWSMLEGRHQAPPLLHPQSRSHDRV